MSIATKVLWRFFRRCSAPSFYSECVPGKLGGWVVLVMSRLSITSIHTLELSVGLRQDEAFETRIGPKRELYDIFEALP